MEEFVRGSLLLPVLALIVGFVVLFTWLISVEFRLYRLSRMACDECGSDVSRTARRCSHCGKDLRAL